MADLALSFDPALEGTDAFGDLALSATGDLQMTQGMDAVRQSLELRLRAGTGDYFMAMNEGLGWFEMLSSTSGYTAAFDATLKNQVLATPGVIALLDWDVSFNRPAGFVSINMQVQSADGVINFSLPVSATGGA